MPFIPHTEQDIKSMLSAIGVTDISALFSEIPSELLVDKLDVPSGLSEMQLKQKLSKRLKSDVCDLNFIGAGAYEHHIPAAVWDVTSRGEWMTAYTPYQAEASQGTLQLLYEFQTMMSQLMALDVANASMYDGATALAEAVLMANRLTKGNKQRVLVPETLSPFYRDVLTCVLSNRDIIIDIIPMTENGVMDVEALKKKALAESFALIIPFPNFFGNLEEVDFLTNYAHEYGLQVIALVNPLCVSWLKPPGVWGKNGVDIACGEGQPLGIPLASGGPYFGFLTCKQACIRQLPGRLVGRTTTTDNKQGFTLTLQAREQHIRRAKATSNICTNQGLLVTAATIFISLMGPEGLKTVATDSHLAAMRLKAALAKIDGVTVLFEKSPQFHEFVVKTNKPIEKVISYMVNQGIEPGFSLQSEYKNQDLLKNALLICVTETKSETDLDKFVASFKEALQKA